MTGGRRHRLTLALLVSLLLHLAVFGAPGWRVPTLDDLLAPEAERNDNAPRLEAHLAAPSLRDKRPVGASSSQRAAKSPPADRVAAPSVPPGVLAMPPVVEDGQVVDDPVADADADVKMAAASGHEESPVVLADAVTASAAEAAMPIPADAGRGPTAKLPDVTLPRRGSVRFAARRGEGGFVLGQSTHHWRHDGRHYFLDSVTETTGLVALFRSVRVVWQSEGEVVGDGLRPQAFRSEKGNASFDWQAMKLSLSAGARREVALLPGVQDVLSMFYQLGIMLPKLRQEDGQVAGSFPMFVTTGRKLERYRFDVLGEERLVIRQHGAQRTLHLRTLAGDQTIDIWLGLDVSGLPLRIRYSDGKGDVNDLLAEDIDFEGMKGSKTSH